MERFARVNSFCTVKRIVTLYINVWKEDINSRRLPVWIRASKKDFELVKDLGLKETGILVSCSDYHIFYKMKMNRREAMEHYLNIVRECLEIGISPAAIWRILLGRIFMVM